MLDINIYTPFFVMEQLKRKFKQKRLFLNLTQEGLSKRSGVSLGSLKRFESSGHISLESLLKLSSILECLGDFLHIANPVETITSIGELLNEKKEKIKKRGSVT